MKSVLYTLKERAQNVFHWLREYVFVSLFVYGCDICVRTSLVFCMHFVLKSRLTLHGFKWALLILFFFVLCISFIFLFSKKSNNFNKNNNNNKDNNQQQPIFVTSHSKRNDSYLEYHSQLNVSLSNTCSKNVYNGK